MRPDLPKLIGHRGAAKVAPENTAAGFAAAAAAGVRWVEVDAKITKDGVVVLMHDDRLDRTTNGFGLVESHTVAQLADLDAGCWFSGDFRGERIPTLKAAMGQFARLGLGCNIEIKPSPGLEEETARLVVGEVQADWPSSLPAPLISSFAVRSLEVALALAPELPRGYLASKLPEGWRDLVARLRCATVNLGARGLTRETVQMVVAEYPLAVWTVNEASRARELLSWGAASIISDDPHLVV
jgi:glycerophosphoryl diester phosphodiesterase